MIAMMLDEYEKSSDHDEAREIALTLRKNRLKNKDVIGACTRAVVRFYHERTPCSCLDKKYEAVKSQPKIACCDVCSKMKKRRSMLICAKCRAFQYCSRECQLKHWPTHKDWCKELCKLRQDKQDDDEFIDTFIKRARQKKLISVKENV